MQEKLPVARHVTGKRYGAAIAQASVNGAEGLVIVAGDGNLPSHSPICGRGEGGTREGQSCEPEGSRLHLRLNGREGINQWMLAHSHAEIIFYHGPYCKRG